MLICFKCQQSLPNYRLFGRHLRFHNLTPNERYVCAQSGCEAGTFLNFSNLCKHIRKQHPLAANESESFQSFSATSFLAQASEDIDDIGSETTDNFEVEEISSEEFEKNLEKSVNTFICNMYSNNTIPRNKVQFIVECTENLFHQVLSQLHCQVKKTASSAENVNEENLTSLDSTFSAVESTFHKFRSEYIRLKFFQNQGTYVAPESVTFDYKLMPRGAGTANFHFSMEPKSIQFVPIRKIFKSFLEEPGVFDKIAENVAILDSEKQILSDFTQGELWKKTIQILQNDPPLLENVLHWPLFLFSDDYECGNPLGSHAGDSKLCGVYVSLPLIPLEYRSMINNIFLFGLIDSKDKDEVPNNILFRAFFDELKYLSTEGIEIITSSFKGTVKLHLGLLLGDNLGLHQITDFIACFTANYPCRFCRVHRDVMRTQTQEDPDLLRTVHNYNADVLAANPSETGINKPSIWNELPNVHVVENTSFDLHHDILQGAAAFDLKLILNFAVQHKYVNIHEINNLILNTDYGPRYKKNKPVPLQVTSANTVKVKMSAAELMNFVVVFGILFSRFFPEGDPVWKLYQLLREIMDVIFSPCIDKKRLDLLKPLIQEHHKIYLIWSEEQRLKNKQHHILHYPRLIEQLGPPIHYWAMRNEHKHQQGKQTAVSVATRRNLSKTVAIRHQILHHCYMQSGTVLKDRVQFGLSFEIQFHELPECKNLPPDFAEKWQMVPWVTIHGTKYESGMVLVLPVENQIFPDPEFGEIKFICVDEGNDVGFFCEDLITSFFNSHVQCYEIEYSTSKSHCFVKHKCLSHSLPTNVITGSSGDLFIPYRYRV